MGIIRIPSFPIIGHRKVGMKAKLKRILYPDISPRSAAIFNVLKMLIAMVIDGDHVMVRDVIYGSRFFQNWHSPELMNTLVLAFNTIRRNSYFLQLTLQSIFRRRRTFSALFKLLLHSWVTFVRV